MIRLHWELTEEKVEDPLEIYRKAKSGDKEAERTFKIFGRRIGELLKPHILSFKADCLVVGGGISNAFEFFGESLRSSLSELKHRVEVKPSRYSYSSLLGILKILIERGETL
ncbi:MAG: ROK family protein [Thermotogae bacterium]|nr:ROK family protein [Thermotogota bacterium]